VNIAYICTNYNNSALTVAAVASLLKSGSDHTIRVIVVDNASRADELQVLRRMSAAHPIVHVIANANNVGYFAGLNLGIEALRKLYPDIGWVIVGNNDLEFPEDFCGRLQHAQPDFQAHSVISPDIVTLDGEHQNPHVISDISTVREIFYDLYYTNYYLGQAIYKLAKMFPKATRRGDEDQWQTARPIYQGHGACYLLTPKFFDNYGTLWAPTFMMAEEMFLSLQLKKGGEQVYYSPAIRVMHHWHGSLQSVPSRRRWNMARDAHREYRKHVKVFQSTGY
jgi:GT2 family glycosyltransferase